MNRKQHKYPIKLELDVAECIQYMYRLNHPMGPVGRVPPNF